MLAVCQAATSGSPSPPHIWLDSEGQPLPFQDFAAIERALRSAEVIQNQEIGRGITGAKKLELEFEGTRFHAVFRSFDARSEPKPLWGTKRRKPYRDAAVFEAAAYELSQLLGIERVPPTVTRRLGEVDGTLQIWLEGGLPEDVLGEGGQLHPPDLEHWARQRQIMHAFDALIANRDRHWGNRIIDSDWRIWLIDHSRSFGETRKLISRDKLVRCDRQLWDTLQRVDEAALEQRLGALLTPRQLEDLSRRLTKLRSHINKLIATRGEEAVLFEMEAASVVRASSQGR